MKSEMEADMRERATALVKITTKYGIQVETLFEDKTEAIDFEGDDADEIQHILGYFDGMSWFFDEHESQPDFINSYAMSDIEQARNKRQPKPRK